MLKNNAFSAEKLPTNQSSGISSIEFDAEKYINDYRLLDIRSGVLEEERQDYLMQL